MFLPLYLRVATVAGLGLAPVALLQAETLIPASPFVTGAAATAPAVTTDNGPIQLSAIFPVGDTIYYGIYSPSLKRTRWVKMGERGNFSDNSPAFTVRSVKTVDGSDQVTVDYQGSAMILGLKQSKVASSTTPGAGQPGAPRGGPAAAQPLRGGPAAGIPIGNQPNRGGGQGFGGGGGLQGGGQGGGGRGQGGGGRGGGGGQAPAASADQVAAATAAFQNRQNQRTTAAATGQPAVVTPTTPARGGGGRRGGN